MSATLSSHVLDTHLGRPATDIAVTLHRIVDHNHTLLLADGKTNHDGRISPDCWHFHEAMTAAEQQLGTGRYTLTFDTQSYFDDQKLSAFYPQVMIDFVVSDTGHYHIPLLLSAHGYSTYRGS